MTPSMLGDKKVTFGKVRGQVNTLVQTLPDTSNPLSVQFVAPPGNTPGELFKYLVVLQMKKYNTTILESMPNQRMHMRHIKELLKTHDALTIKRAIKYAQLRCERPYSIKWVRVYANNMKELMEL